MVFFIISSSTGGRRRRRRRRRQWLAMVKTGSGHCVLAGRISDIPGNRPSLVTLSLPLPPSLTPPSHLLPFTWLWFFCCLHSFSMSFVVAYPAACQEEKISSTLSFFHACPHAQGGMPGRGVAGLLPVEKTRSDTPLSLPHVCASCSVKLKHFMFLWRFGMHAMHKTSRQTNIFINKQLNENGSGVIYIHVNVSWLCLSLFILWLICSLLNILFENS